MARWIKAGATKRDH